MDCSPREEPAGIAQGFSFVDLADELAQTNAAANLNRMNGPFGQVVQVVQMRKIGMKIDAMLKPVRSCAMDREIGAERITIDAFQGHVAFELKITAYPVDSSDEFGGVGRPSEIHQPCHRC